MRRRRGRWRQWATAVREPRRRCFEGEKARARSVGNERTGACASSTIREWWVPHAVNGSLTEGATSCLTVGPCCHKRCQSAFSGRSVLFETNSPKCGSSVRLERKLVVFRNFASKVVVLCYILDCFPCTDVSGDTVLVAFHTL
jgi:hypothetical protein